MSDEEMVAWVDDDEKVIKIIPRTLANSDPKYLHREIAAIVYDENKRILLQQRSFESGSDRHRGRPRNWAIARFTRKNSRRMGLPSPNSSIYSGKSFAIK